MAALPIREDSLSVEVWNPIIQRAYSSIFTAVLHKYRHKHKLYEYKYLLVERVVG